MAKPEPGPVLTLQPVPAPKLTWWQTHRRQVLSITALIGGFYLGSHITNPAPETPPLHTTPANPLPKPTATSPTRQRRIASAQEHSTSRIVEIAVTTALEKYCSTRWSEPGEETCDHRP